MTPHLRLDIIPEGSRLIVGLSGGADSVALLAMLLNSGVTCVATHCNFGLRGDESDRDESHCRALCDRLDVELIVKHFDVSARRKATGESIEMACRSLRYNWWNSLIDNGLADYVAVGHHMEDNVETFFLNLLRGSGLKGLKGMDPVTGRILRPMLDIKRCEIERYLVDMGLTYIVDSSNLSDEYKRNKLRHNILPAIEREFPGAMDAMSRSIGLLAGNNALYRHMLKDFIHKQDTDPIDVNRLLEMGEAAETALYELTSGWGLGTKQIPDIIRAAADSTRGGKWFPTPSGPCLLDRGRLYPPRSIQQSDTDREIAIDHKPFSLDIIGKDEFDRLRRDGKLSSHSLYLDATILDQPHKFVLRSWRQGDRIAPFGMRGTRLVSDILTDAKIPADEKKQIRILTIDGTIAWVIGLRTSRHYSVTTFTEKVAVVNYRP